MDGIRLERVGKKGEGVELIVAVGCCLHGHWLRKVLWHGVDGLGTFEMRTLSPMVCVNMIYLSPLFPLMLGLLAHGGAGRRIMFLIVLELRILGVIVMIKVLSETYNVVMTMLAEM